MPNPEFNPFAGLLAAARTQLQRNAAELTQAEEELAWYENFQSAAVHEHVNVQRRDIADAAVRLQRAQTELNQQAEAVHQATQAIPPIWKFGFTERSVAQRKRDAAMAELGRVRGDVERLVSRQRELEAALVQPEQALARYRVFDLLQVRAKCSLIPTAQELLESTIADLIPKHQAAEEELAPLRAQLQTLEGDERMLASRISKADRLLAQLQTAANGYERKQVHELCEEELGTGNPDKAGARDRRQLDFVRSSHAKVRKMIEAVARRHVMDIRTVVLDGSNLLNGTGPGNVKCFLGLAALDVLVPALIAQNKRLVLYFDRGAPKKLGMSTAALREHFAQWTKEVYVERAGYEADASILGTADLDAHTYVISCDNFIDYAVQYPWLKDRLLRPHVHHDRILLLDMNIRLAFSPGS